MTVSNGSSLCSTILILFFEIQPSWKHHLIYKYQKLKYNNNQKQNKTNKIEKSSNGVFKVAMTLLGYTLGDTPMSVM